MTTPPLLLGAFLIFWGWQTGLMPMAMVMAALMEGSRWIRFRIDLSPRDSRRISDLIALALVAFFAYALVSRQPIRIVYTFFQWIPVGLFPLMLAQVYSTSGKIDRGAIFWRFRNKAEREGQTPMAGVKLCYPYLIVVLISAGSANTRTPWFYAGIFLLMAWSLWPVRRTRSSPALWMGLLLLSALAGYGGHVGLSSLQGILSEKAPEWFVKSGDQDMDAYRSTTAIGEITTLKMSDRILFRVEAPAGQVPPPLLRRTTFNTYRSSIWVAAHANFSPVRPEDTGKGWKFGHDADGRQVTVIDSLRDGQGILKLPTGCFEITDLPVGAMEKNPYAVVKVSQGPGLIRYRALYSENAVLDAPPATADLAVPAEEKPHIAQMVRELNLAGEPPSRVLRKVGDFFQNRFRYSLVLNSGHKPGALEDFLMRSRAGHCEYFASATVLLLREAGIPARYATGFSVQDFSRMEGRYLVRERHAHAWALAFVNGAWRDLDTTPPVWGELEAQKARWWTPISDLLSWLTFRISQWRWLEKDAPTMWPLLCAVLAVLIILVVRLLKRGSFTRIKRGNAIEEKKDRKPGQDSEFYEIERRLVEEGHLRHSWEPFSAWIGRIEKDRREEGSIRVAPFILDLHYRLRFDPEGLSQTDRAVLKEGVRSWIDQVKRAAAKEDPIHDGSRSQCPA